MLKYLFVSLIFIVIQITVELARAENQFADIHQFLSISDHQYVRCSDTVFISKDKGCIDQVQKDVAVRYDAIINKYKNNILLTQKITEYYKYWIESVSKISEDCNNSNNIDKRINEILARKVQIQNSLK